MSKAISGAIEIAAGAALIATGAGAAFGWSLVAMGVGAELSAVAGLLQGNTGIGNTVRQAAAPRRIIYGTQRVGAVEVYESTTGSSKDQYNFVYVFAAHEVTNFTALYLDGRQVFFAGPGNNGYTVRNGIGFGGGADGQNHIGPDGSTYNFANGYSGHNGVYVEARYGDQALGDYISGLTANDSRWGPSAGNTPSLMGCAYIYLKCEYNTDVFPSKPDPRMTIKGKAVYDPRTGETSYSENWALVVADIIQNTDYGLGDAVNQDQLIAAANICDEQVQFFGSGGGYEARYTAHYTWTLDKSVGDVLNDLMTGAGGRISFIEGEWYIFPATYVAPVVSFSVDNLLAKPTWSAQRKFRDKVNSVQGTYIAPNYPYSAAGNLYDSNGWYNGTIQNNFPYAFTPTSYPTYATDTVHGYASDQYLTEDNGIELPQTMDFASVLSITQAQRLAKIALLRNRQQGSGTLTMGVEALVLQPNDTFTFTFPQRGWANKLLEVQRMDFSIQNDQSGVPQIQVQVTVNETDPSVYVWNSTDELTPYAVEAAPTDPGQYVTAPPTNLLLTSSAATALTQPDGTVVPRIEVTWDTPADTRVGAIQIQYQLVGASAWSDGGTVSAASNTAFLPAIAGASYNMQIRSLRSNGGTSVWVGDSGFTASLVLSISSQDGIGASSLVGEAYNDGTAGIECMPFSAQYGTASIAIFPAGGVLINSDGTIGGSGAALAQQTLYYVYYVDPTYVGGNVAPIATTNKADFIGKLGYFEIDSVVTPYAATTGADSGGSLYYPTTSTDFGTRSTLAPDNAVDGDLSTYATVSGSFIQRSGGTTPTQPDSPDSVSAQAAAPPVSTPTYTNGDCTWSGLPSMTFTAASRLTVIAAATVFNGGSLTITALVGGTTTTMANLTATTAQATYTLPISAGVDLSTISVECSASSQAATSNSASCSLRVYEVYVQS